MPKNTRRGRRAPSEPSLTSPLPLTTTTTTCFLDHDYGYCLSRDREHQQQSEHVVVVVGFLKTYWKVIDAAGFAEDHGIEPINDAADELLEYLITRRTERIRSRSGFAATVIRKHVARHEKRAKLLESQQHEESQSDASKQQRGNLRIVSDSDGADAIGGAS